jgi:hypothetical protein
MKRREIKLNYTLAYPVGIGTEAPERAFPLPLACG